MSFFFFFFTLFHRQLIKTLEKSLSSDFDCGLKSCIGLRAASKVERDNNTVHGTFRFEAVIPDASFQIARINTLPLLSTPLALNLTKKI